MSDAARKFVLGMLLFLAAGTAIGWLYGRPGIGLMAAALVALAWQVRQLLSFDRALRTGNFDDFRYGEGIWEQIDKATRRKQNYRQLLLEVRKSTNAMPDGAVILNTDNEIIACNRAAKQLAGLKRKKDRGQRVDNILRDPELTRLLHSEDEKLTVEIESPVIDGNWLHCRVVPYGADQKLLLLRDVTDRMQLTKMRRDFVANASHELRSPLTVISGYLDSLADDEHMPPAWRKPVAQMRAQARRMRHILGELLELSRLESSSKAGSEQTVDVTGLFESVKQSFDGHADIAEIVVEANSSAKLKGSAAEIETVVVNLLSNAIRYTPSDGKVTLTWSSNSDGAYLVVTDTGEGIDPEFIPRLTERFLKHVLARHDAELIITSNPGEGSEFRCHFPPERVFVSPPAALS
jgi:two-component system phosphate regulon sensor histidine kinase PhoR